MLDVLMRILNDRGQLMPEEKANMKASQPAREMRGFLRFAVIETPLSIFYLPTTREAN